MSDSSTASTDATMTVRLIKSFEYKNFRNVVFHHVDLTKLTLTDLEALVWERVQGNAVLSRLFPPGTLDTFKLYCQPHQAKTNNPIINVGDDDTLVLLDYARPLQDLGFQHQMEVSFFHWSTYELYRANPQFKWE